MASPLQVLHVVTDPDAANFVLETLSGAGPPCNVHRLESREKLPALLREPFDVILADYEGVASGESSPLEMSLAICPHVPFICIGDSIGEEAAGELVRAGAAGYVLRSRLSRLWPTIQSSLDRAVKHAAQRSATEAFRWEQARYQSIVETAQEGIWVIDHEGRTTYANTRMAEMLGLAGGEEMDGRSMYDFMDDRGRAIAAKNLDRRNRGIAEEHEFLFQTVDGRDLWTLIATSLLKNEEGKVIEVLGMITDITERKLALDELRDKLAIIERQRTELQALSSPIIEVWEGVLCVPVVSAVDSIRAGQIMESLLAALVQTEARFAIIDLTGVETIDPATADHFFKIVSAARLIGAESIVTGLRPPVAQAIVDLDVNLPDVETLPNLKEALRLCMRKMQQRRNSGRA